MNKICTSIEQSQKLIELGIDVNTADMCWQNNEFPIGFNDDEAVPAWSLSALLDILPQETRLLKSATGNTYHCDCPKGNVDKWFENPLDAAFEMIVWLKENKKI